MRTLRQFLRGTLVTLWPGAFVTAVWFIIGGMGVTGFGIRAATALFIGLPAYLLLVVWVHITIAVGRAAEEDELDRRAVQQAWLESEADRPRPAPGPRPGPRKGA